MGYNAANGTPSAVTNGFGGLEPVLISQTELTAVPSANGLFTANLPADAAIVAAGQPAFGRTPRPPLLRPNRRWSSTTISAPKCCSTSISPRPGANTWEVAVYNQANATPGTSFPYGAPGSPELASQTLTFDADHRQAHDLERRTDITIPVPNGVAFTLDLASTTSLPPATPCCSPRSTATRRAASTRSRSARTAPSTRNTRTARSRRSTASRSPRCRAPTSSTSSPATSIRKAAIPATSASASPMKAAWAASCPERSRTRTSTSPKN